MVRVARRAREPRSGRPGAIPGPTVESGWKKVMLATLYGVGKCVVWLRAVGPPCRLLLPGMHAPKVTRPSGFLLRGGTTARRRAQEECDGCARHPESGGDRPPRRAPRRRCARSTQQKAP